MVTTIPTDAPQDRGSEQSIEQKAVAGLLRKEAATWMAARTKAPCKTLDDLKKIKGIDFKKIDSRRDRLVCF